MNYFLTGLFALILCGCTQTAKKQEQIQDSQENTRITSEVLKDLPATFKGVSGDAKFDSALITLVLNKDMNSMVSKQYYLGGKVVVNLNDKGTWMIQGVNVVSTLKDDSSQRTENFKLISDQVVRLLDSTSNEFSDGKNYDLIRIESNKE
ncbi:hypothetical protein BH11BAC2_BH11BAC2_18880 [soil metagenome]